METEQDLNKITEDPTLTILQKFLKFRKAFETVCIPKDAGPYQRDSMQTAFDAGGQITMMVLTSFAQELPEEEASKQMRELHEYFNTVAKLMAERAIKHSIRQALGGAGSGISILSMEDLADGKLEQLLGKG